MSPISLLEDHARTYEYILTTLFNLVNNVIALRNSFALLYGLG